MDNPLYATIAEFKEKLSALDRKIDETEDGTWKSILIKTRESREQNIRQMEKLFQKNA